MHNVVGTKRVFGPQIFTLDFPTKHLTLHKTASSTRAEHKLKETVCFELRR